MRLAFAIVLMGSTASADSRCKSEAVQRPVPNTKAAACHKPAHEQVLAKRIAQDFQPEHEHGKAARESPYRKYVVRRFPYVVVYRVCAEY